MAQHFAVFAFTEGFDVLILMCIVKGKTIDGPYYP